MTGQDGLSSSFVETVAGFTAGVVSTLCLHPLDLVKTRLQVDRNATTRLGSSIQIVRDISRYEGGFAAFYRGLAPNLVGNSTSWALYFLFYGSLKNGMCIYRGSFSALTSFDYFLASGTAGALTSLLTNPIWVIKTRMLSTGSQFPGAYSSFTTGVKHIYRTEGVPGFYRGLVPSLFGVSHGALQFMAYDRLKVLRSHTNQDLSSLGVGHENKTRKLNNVDFLALSSLSKLFAGCATYPYQVIRSRLQTYDAPLMYRGATDAIMQVWAREGISGFYKGLGPNLLRVLPSTWVTFLVYENVKIFFT
ncbi:mitochondrial carrier [Penicillium frequentans]|nr:mitochondrial carrier [Penicillium glabrum]